MSRIYKSSASEVFDNYSKNMHRYNLKKEASNPIIKSIVKSLKAGGETLQNLIGNMPIDDAIKAILESGSMTAEELSPLVGRSAADLKKLLTGGTDVAKEVAEVAVKTAPETMKAAEAVYPILLESSEEISKHAHVIRAISLGLKDMAGKTSDEIAEMITRLKKSGSSLKGQITKVKNKLAALEEQVANLLDEKMNLTEMLRVAKAWKEESVKIIAKLESHIAKLTADAANAAGIAAETIAKLEAEGIQLAAKTASDLEKAVEAAESSAYIKGLAAGLKEAAEKNNTVAAKAAVAAAEAAAEAEAKVAAKAAKSVASAAPEAAEAVTEAATKASNKGAAKATKDVADTAKSTTGAGRSPSSFIEKLLLKISPNISKQMIGGVSSVMTGGATLGASAISKLLSALTFMAILGLAATGVGIGVYMIWLNWLKDNFALVGQHVGALRGSQRATIGFLRELQFRESTGGQKRTEQLIAAIEKSFSSLEALGGQELTKEQFFKAFVDLTAMDAQTSSYFAEKDVIEGDLASSVGWNEAIISLEDLAKKTLEFKEVVLTAMESADELPSGEAGRGVDTPVGRPAPGQGRPDQSDQPNQSEQRGGPGHVPHPVTIYGQEIDIGHLSRGLRSAAPRMIQKVMLSPEGLAFTDPDDVWGGWLPKTPVEGADGKIVQNKTADYLRALKYLYLNKIFSRGDLRRFVRQSLPKVGRRRASGWKDAVRHYRGNVGKYANQENNEFFTQKFAKPANSKESSVIYNNGIITDMHKKADQISKQYFQDAVTGLADQYAKSYYAGLKSMYDQKLGKTEADVVKLYEVHNESGADLIGAAHPKTIDIADAMGNGGVVENQIEQHRHNVGVAQSMPSGNFRGRHAWVIRNLVKLADQTDKSGMIEVSDLIDKALEELTSI